MKAVQENHLTILMERPMTNMGRSSGRTRQNESSNSTAGTIISLLFIFLSILDVNNFTLGT